jgi:hypothetical protein
MLETGMMKDKRGDVGVVWFAAADVLDECLE